jgi:hypothetical protein
VNVALFFEELEASAPERLRQVVVIFLHKAWGANQQRLNFPS